MAEGATSLAVLTVFDGMADGVLAFSDDGRFLYANQRAHALYGTDDLVGRPIAEFRPGRSEVLLAGELRTLLHEGHLAGEHTIRCPDGSVAALLFRSVANYLPGVHLTVVRTAEAGTQQAAFLPPDSELANLLRAVFDATPYPVLVVADDRRFVDSNRAARHLLGVSRAELATRRVDDFTPDRLRPEVDEIWATLLERGSVEGRGTLTLASGLRRAIAFKATAAVTPGYHMVTLRSAREEPEKTEPLAGPAPSLTAREREILQLVARGHSAVAIAAHVAITAQTARTHIRNALRKLGAHTRPHAVAIAIREHQIEP